MTRLALRLAALLLGLALASPAEAGIRRYGTYPVPDQTAEAATPAPATTRGVVVRPGSEGG